MNCPRCGSNQIFVIDSRTKDAIVKRRRRCAKCYHTFDSIEVYETEFKKFAKYETAVKNMAEYVEAIRTIKTAIKPFLKGE